MKNCLSKEELFDFCNQELEERKMTEIKKHAENCKACQDNIDLMKSNIDLIKDSINSLNPDIEIKTLPNYSKKANYIRKINYNRILSLAAGVSLIITISTIASLKIFHNLKPVKDYEYLNYIPDMNNAWKNNSVVVTEYDNYGNPIKHQLIGNKN